MDRKVGERVAGKDGTFRKINRVGDRKYWFYMGLSGEEGSSTHNQFEDWAAEPFDYDDATEAMKESDDD